MDIVKNPAQEEAIAAINGPVLLISCPGSGKTTTLVRRIHHMIETGISPSSILMVTFTKDAANGMKSKYQSLFSAEPGVTFQTIHALCFNILLNEGVCASNDVLYKERQMDFFLEFMRSKYIRDAWETAVAAVTGISCARNNYLKPEQINVQGISRELFLEAYRVYDEWKRERRVIDFDDMLIKCNELLQKDPGILKKYQDRFRYVQCDEYQDTNYIQKDILYALTAVSRNLCVVGDDDQSIYAFRGAHPEIMLGFEKDFPDAKVIRMGTNYRSAKKIIEVSEKLVGHNTRRFSKEFTSYRGLSGAEGRCVSRRVQTKKEEMDALLQSIKRHHESGIPYNHMAVLFRTNVQAQGPVRVLSAAGIPYYSTESVKSKYEGFIFRDFRDYVSLACGTGGNREILNVLNHPNRYLRDKEFRAVEEFTDNNMYEAVIRETSSKEEWQRDRAIDSISCWLDHFGPGRVDMSMYPHTVWNAFIDGIDYLRYIEDYSRDRNLDYEDLQEEVKDLNGEALDFEKLEDWFRHADAETAKLREEMAKKDRNGVVLTTMHRAKGLEWDVVYIIDADEYITPHKKSMQDAAQMEEERRLFYVAMTRAKDELIVLGSGTPSRFISEMNETVKRGATSAPKPAKNSFVISPDKVQKKLAGAGVEHKKFGPGRVDHYEPGVIVVTFKEHGEKKFQFPETFCKGIIWYTT